MKLDYTEMTRMKNFQTRRCIWSSRFSRIMPGQTWRENGHKVCPLTKYHIVCDTGHKGALCPVSPAGEWTHFAKGIHLLSHTQTINLPEVNLMGLGDSDVARRRAKCLEAAMMRFIRGNEPLQPQTRGVEAVVRNVKHTRLYFVRF